MWDHTVLPATGSGDFPSFIPTEAGTRPWRDARLSLAGTCTPNILGKDYVPLGEPVASTFLTKNWVLLILLLILGQLSVYF